MPIDKELLAPIVLEDPPESCEGQWAEIDKSDPRSLINICPQKIAAALESIPEFVMELTEKQLWVRILADHDNDQGMLNRMRLNFWLEYNRAQNRGVRICYGAIFGGVCTKQAFEAQILVNPLKVMWIVLPPRDYQVAMEDLLYLGIDEMRTILETPIKDPVTGFIDARLAAVKAKIFELVDMRVKGAVVQRIDQRNLNVNLEASEKKEMPPASMEDIDKRLAELEQQTSRQLPRGQLIASPLAKSDIIEGELVPKT